jgi:flagellar motor switch protein FliG
LLSSLPRGQADALLARLDRRQARSVLAEITKGDTVTPDEREAVILEFAAAELASQHRRGTDNAAARPPAGAADVGPLAFLHDVHPQILAAVLSDERPQTVALIVSHVPSAYGAELISCMPPAEQLAVIRAVAAMEPTDSQVVLDVAAVLKRRMLGMAA